MSFRKYIHLAGLAILFMSFGNTKAQDSLLVMATLYNRSFEVIPACHIINVSNHKATTSNKMGIFTIPANEGDTLLIRNIVYQELRIPVSVVHQRHFVVLEWARYELPEAKVFEWGSTYEDFRDAIVGMEDQQTLGEELGWPRADPNKIPYDMDEQYVKSTAFLLQSPISYLYQNYNRKAKSKRKLYWKKKNQGKQEHFDSIMSGENIASITGLQGEALLDFLSYLGLRMVCDFNCTDYEVYAEIYAHWEVYQEIR